MSRPRRQPRQSEFRSTSGFVTEPWYGPSHMTAAVIDEQHHYPPPGAYPFTRGFHGHGYRDRLWDMEMYAGFGDAEEANRRYRLLLDNGATGGVSMALDLPTQLGYDSDDPMARGEVGRTGVALDTYADIERLFGGVDLGEAGHVFSTANSIGPVVYAWILTYCRRNGVDPSSFRLQIQNDPIKEYVARGTHFLPIDAAVRLATDVVVYSHEQTPEWLPISVSGSHMKQAGASPAKEAAFTIANAICYMTEIESKGVALRDFNPTLELHFCTDMDFFEEVAKYRAVRRAWSTIAVERFDAPAEAATLGFRLHAATSGLPLTAQQPMNNIARITLQVLAQILGGCEGTRTASWDEALALPTEDAAITSLRINQIVGYETGIPDTTDPLGGSYYVEALTDRIVNVIMEEVGRIDAMGGMLAAIRNRYLQEDIAETAYRQQREFDAGERIVVGVNRYRSEETVAHPRFKLNEAAERRQLDLLAGHHTSRDGQAVRAALANLVEVCKGEDNVMPAVMQAVDAGATLGEITGVWREVFGEHREDWVAL